MALSKFIQNLQVKELIIQAKFDGQDGVILGIQKSAIYSKDETKALVMKQTTRYCFVQVDKVNVDYRGATAPNNTDLS